MNPPLFLSVTNHVATFSINGPPWNLMSLEYIDYLEAELPGVLADDAIRALVFTAEGLDHFSAGMNLRQIPEGVRRAGSADAFFGQRHRVLDMIENGGKPAIATLFGYCLGAGLELPLACHFRLAADTGAQIGLPELDLGTVPAWGGSARLPRLVGASHAPRSTRCSTSSWATRPNRSRSRSRKSGLPLWRSAATLTRGKACSRFRRNVAQCSTDWLDSPH